LDPSLRDRPGPQRKVYFDIRRPKARPEVLEVVGRRVANLLGHPEPRVAEYIVDELARASGPVPPCVRISYLRAVCNAWPTSARLHTAPRTCVFGCDPVAPDTMRHYVACPVSRGVAFAHLGLAISGDEVEAISDVLRLRHRSPRDKLALFLYADMIFNAMCTMRQALGLRPKAVMISRLKDIIRRSRPLYDLVRERSVRWRL